MHIPLTRRTLMRLLGASGFAAALSAGPAPVARAANRVGEELLVLSGETPPAADVVTWRVLRGDIDTTGSGLLARAAGFVIPEEGPGLVVVDAANQVLEVENGNAAFVAEGAQQQYASVGPEATRYLRIGLVTLGDADFPADGVLVTQPPYPEIEPPAAVRLELYRVPIVFGEEWELPGGVGWPLAIASGGSLKFASGDTEIALRDGEAQVLVTESPDEPWIARCPRGTEEADLLLALVIDPAAPAPEADAEAGEEAEGETEEPEATPEPKVEQGVVTVRALRCAADEFDDTCVVRADPAELARYRFALIGPVNENRTLRDDTVFYALTEDAEQAEDGGFTFTVPAGLYEFGSRGEGLFPMQLDGETYTGKPFDITGEHVIEVMTPNQ